MIHARADYAPIQDPRGLIQLVALIEDQIKRVNDWQTEHHRKVADLPGGAV